MSKSNTKRDLCLLQLLKDHKLSSRAPLSEFMKLDKSHLGSPPSGLQVLNHNIYVRASGALDARGETRRDLPPKSDLIPLLVVRPMLGSV